MSLRDTYAYAIQTAKGKFDGSAQEKDGKLHWSDPSRQKTRKTRSGRAIKTIPDWRNDIVADIQVTGVKEMAASVGASTKTYTVKAGDTLSGIAKSQLGNASAYMKIFEANKDQLSDPDKIKPGQVLKLP